MKDATSIHGFPAIQTNMHFNPLQPFYTFGPIQLSEGIQTKTQLI
jgi:hypothetical protein